MKIVINAREYGAFRLSPLALQEHAKRKGKECYFFTHRAFHTHELVSLTLEKATTADKEQYVFAYSIPNPQNFAYEDRNGFFLGAGEAIPRDDADLVAVVEELGERANGNGSALKIVEIPDGVKWTIEEDGDEAEIIVEQHRTWR